MYKLINVCKSFLMPTGPIQVLDNISLEIAAGEWTALVGRSGSGKTTLLQLLGGLDKPTSGSILIENQDITKMSESLLASLRRRKIGFIFQSYHLFPELTALENAILPALNWGANRNAAVEKARKYLEQFGLAERLNHRPRELSGGEQQRVAIARALINSPSVILADEPTGNLDKRAANEIIAILDEIRQETKMTLVMVTHDQDIAKLADKTITLHHS